MGFDVILANPLKIKLIAESRMKNDDVYSEILVKLMRNDRIPESYIPSKDIMGIRRIVRSRIQIKQSIRSYNNRIRYEIFRLHVNYEIDHTFTWKGSVFLRTLKSPRIDSYLNVLDGLGGKVKKIDAELTKYFGIEKEKLLMTIPGIGLIETACLYRHDPLGKAVPDEVHYDHIAY